MVMDKFRQLWMFFVRKGFSVAALPHTPDMWRIPEIVGAWREWPVLARYSWNSLVSFHLALFSLFVDDDLHRAPVHLMFWKYFSIPVLILFTIEILYMIWKERVDSAIWMKPTWWQEILQKQLVCIWGLSESFPCQVYDGKFWTRLWMWMINAHMPRYNTYNCAPR